MLETGTGTGGGQLAAAVPGAVPGVRTAPHPAAERHAGAASRTGTASATLAPPVTTAPEIPCDLVTVPARHGLEALDILRLRECDGPVLHDHAGDTLGFLVPAGTADRWDLPGSACAPTCSRAAYAAYVGAAGLHGTAGLPGGTGTAPAPAPVPVPVPAAVPGRASAARVLADVPGTPDPPVAGAGWLVPPAAAAAGATQPTELRAALGEAARTIEAAGRRL